MFHANRARLLHPLAHAVLRPVRRCRLRGEPAAAVHTHCSRQHAESACTEPAHVATPQKVSYKAQGTKRRATKRRALANADRPARSEGGQIAKSKLQHAKLCVAGPHTRSAEATGRAACVTTIAAHSAFFHRVVVTPLVASSSYVAHTALAPCACLEPRSRTIKEENRLSQ